MTRDSDIDLLVLERSPEDARKKSVVVGDALRGLGFPFDVIVMATQRFEETKDLVGGLALPADRGGKVIYEAAWMAHTATSNVSKWSSGTGSPSSSSAAM